MRVTKKMGTRRKRKKNRWMMMRIERIRNSFPRKDTFTNMMIE